MKKYLVIFLIFSVFIFSNEITTENLRKAISNNDIKGVELAIKDGADIDKKYSGGNTNLILACFLKEKEIAELLIKNGANTKVKNINGQGILELASSSEVRKYLMNLGVTW